MSTIKSSDEHLTLNADGSSKDIKLQSNASEKVIIKSDGKVGIGTSSPAKPLEVKDSSDQANIRLQGSVGYCDLSGNGGNGSDFVVLTEGTEKFRVKETGGIRATDGILFGTDTAAANALDDYEEGTWTPNIYNTGHSSGAVTKTGIYTKVGRLVTCFFRVDDGTTGGGTGNLKIGGLPFAPSGMPGSGTLGFCVVRAGSTGGSTGYRRGITYESGTEFNIMETTAADTAVYRYVSSGFSYLAAT